MSNIWLWWSTLLGRGFSLRMLMCVNLGTWLPVFCCFNLLRRKCDSSCLATWHYWSCLFLEAALWCPLFNAASKITSHQYWTIPLFQFLCRRSLWSRFVDGSRREGGMQLFLCRFPLLSSSAHRCPSFGLWGEGGRGISRVWSQENLLHINFLERHEVVLALAVFLPQLAGQAVVLLSDNATVVAYLRNQGALSRKWWATWLVKWFSGLSFNWWLSVQYIPSKKNVLADQLSRLNLVLPTEWSLLPRMFVAVCKVFGHPHLNLFTTRANMKLPLYVSPVPETWNQDTF